MGSGRSRVWLSRARSALREGNTRYILCQTFNMQTAVDLSGIQTEGRNANTTNIDKVSTLELCQIINDEDSKVANAVAECLPQIAGAIDSLVERVQCGGRVVYVGAGTSGRLGVLDASELPPTFTADPEQFLALISGGDNALRHAQEGAEDDVEAAAADLKALNLDGRIDSLIGIAASGRTPYVLSCLAYAHLVGCNTIGVACTIPSVIGQSGHVDHMISAVTGPEVVTGSTRLKAGTATKLVLNMLSTGTMINVGKTFGNIMIDVKATNAKLRQRARNILRTICGGRCPSSDADLDDLLHRCDGSVKLAAASLMLERPVSEARGRLQAAGDMLAKVLDEATQAVDQETGPPVNGMSNMGYILCVDGGGSKCAAVIRDRFGGLWRGEAGPCNATDVGPCAAINSIATAIQNSVDACPRLKGQDYRGTPFSRIWVGLAGFDRSSTSAPMTAALEKMFSQPVSNTFRITTDIDLLVTAAVRDRKVSSVIALIAGTGSIAMRFSRNGDQFMRIGRTGGWGYLLGDDGSGFDIGRRAIRHCLAALDRQRNGSNMVPSCGSACRLCQGVLRHFALDGDPNQGPDLLSAVISSDAISEFGSETHVKRRIASVAPSIIELCETNAIARDIIDRAIENLIELLQSLHTSVNLDPATNALVFAGGLLRSEVFRSRLTSAISRSAFQGSQTVTFENVICVPDPAAAGAEVLLEDQGDKL